MKNIKNQKEEFAKKSEIADRYHVSNRTIDNWMSWGILPFWKIGNVVRFKINETDEALKAYRNNSRYENGDSQ